MHRILAVIYHNCGQAPYSGVSVHKHTLHTLHTLHTHTTQREEPKSQVMRFSERERDDREGGTGQTERDMTQGSAAKKAKCGRTQIVRTSDHVPSHKIDQSEVLYSTCASPARGEERGQGESQIQLTPFTHTHTHTHGGRWREGMMR